MKIDLVKIKKSLLRLEGSADDKYIRSYPHYVSYFTEKRQLTEVDVIRGVGFVYSWMPRIMGDYISAGTELLNHLNSKKSGDNSRDLEVVLATHKFLSFSTVAASKFLHFIFPDSFPIYDSHIYRYCWPNQKDHHYMIKKIEYYFEFKLAVLEASSGSLAQEISDIATEKWGYRPSVIRALEFGMFCASKNPL